jgi:hypothetical protein
VSRIVKFPPLHELRGVDVLHNAVIYLREQFRMDMNRDEAQQNLDSRALLINLENALLNELEFGIPVDRKTPIHGGLEISSSEKQSPSQKPETGAADARR